MDFKSMIKENLKDKYSLMLDGKMPADTTDVTIQSADEFRRHYLSATERLEKDASEINNAIDKLKKRDDARRDEKKRISIHNEISKRRQINKIKACIVVVAGILILGIILGIVFGARSCVQKNEEQEKIIYSCDGIEIEIVNMERSYDYYDYTTEFTISVTNNGQAGVSVVYGEIRFYDKDDEFGNGTLELNVDAGPSETKQVSVTYEGSKTVYEKLYKTLPDRLVVKYKITSIDFSDGKKYDYADSAMQVIKPMLTQSEVEAIHPKDSVSVSLAGIEKDNDYGYPCLFITCDLFNKYGTDVNYIIGEMKIYDGDTDEIYSEEVNFLSITSDVLEGNHSAQDVCYIQEKAVTDLPLKNLKITFRIKTLWFADGFEVTYEDAETVVLKEAEYSSTDTTVPNEKKLDYQLSADNSYYIVVGADANISGALSIPSVYNNKPVKEIGEYAFNNCTLLTSVEIPDSVEQINQYAFRNCKGLKEFAVPDNVTEIGYAAFSGCGSLEKIALPFVGRTTSNTAGSDMLLGYIFGSESYVGGTVISQYYNAYYHGDFYIPSSLKEVSVNSGRILYGAFYNCRFLTSVTIGDGVVNIDPEAFSGCRKLVEIYNYSSLQFVIGASDNGKIAYYAKVIHTADEPSAIFTVDGDYKFIGDGTGYYLIDYTGSNDELVLPSDVEGAGYEINARAFDSKSFITSVTVPELVTAMGAYAFYNCNKIETVYWNAIDCVNPASTTIFGNSVASVVFGNNVKTIPNYMLKNCSSLYTVDIPDSVISIGDEAFAGCYNMYSLKLGSSLQTIGTRAFQSCSYLQNITIPASVSTIGAYAFSSCSSLKYVTFENVNGWVAGIFTISASELSNAQYAANNLTYSSYVDYKWIRS